MNDQSRWGTAGVGLGASGVVRLGQSKTPGPAHHERIEGPSDRLRAGPDRAATRAAPTGIGWVGNCWISAADARLGVGCWARAGGGSRRRHERVS